MEQYTRRVSRKDAEVTGLVESYGIFTLDTYEMQRKGDHFKYLETGTIINENQVIELNFKAPAENFDHLLPTFQHMIDSFKFTESDTNQSSSVTNASNS